MSNKTVSALLSSKSNEWYTPSIYIEAVREVMGRIDLDPASCEQANHIVQADKIYTIETNGLMHSWYGNIWLNPPYGTTNGKSNQGIWIRKLIDEYQTGRVKQAVLLINSHTDTRWFHQLFAFPVCFTEGRINFYSRIHKTDTAFSGPENNITEKSSGQTHGSALIYLGPNEEKYIETFSKFGTIVKRVSSSKQSPSTLPLWKEK